MFRRIEALERIPVPHEACTEGTSALLEERPDGSLWHTYGEPYKPEEDVCPNCRESHALIVEEVIIERDEAGELVEAKE